MPAKSCLLSARLRPKPPRSARVSGLAIRMTSVLCSSPSAPMLTSLTIQATLPLPQQEYRPENTSSGLAPPISRQSPVGRAKLLIFPDLKSASRNFSDGVSRFRQSWLEVEMAVLRTDVGSGVWAGRPRTSQEEELP